MPDAFPNGPLLPVSRGGKLAWAAGAIGAIVIGTPLLLADPLKPRDVREPAWAGVIASAADRELTDGRRFGEPADRLGRGLTDGDLIVAGGSVDVPSWAWSVAPSETESGCYQTRDLGIDDGPAVVIRVSTGDQYIGLRITKAPGFQADPTEEGRYVGAVPFLRDTRLAAAGGAGGVTPGPPSVPALIGYFCLDANGQVARWDQGY